MSSFAGADPSKCVDRPSAPRQAGFPSLWPPGGSSVVRATAAESGPGRGVGGWAVGGWANQGHMCKMKLAASTSRGLPLHPLPPRQCLVFVAMTNGRAELPKPEQLSNAAALRGPALRACPCTCPPRHAPWGCRLGIACAAESRPPSPFDSSEIR